MGSLSSLGSKDECSLNSGMEELKGSERLNVLGKMGSRMRPNVADMQFRVFPPPPSSYLICRKFVTLS